MRRSRIAWADLFGARPLRDHEADGSAVDHAVCGIGEFDEHPVWLGVQANDDDRLSAGIDEVPGRVVDGDMNMS